MAGTEPQQTAPRYPVRALRAVVVVPGAFVEGVLAVLLPWSVTQAALRTAWLGTASALIVAAAIAGNLLAAPATRWLGSRRMTIAAAFMAAICLGIAAAVWLMDFALTAFALALLALVADGMADIGFSAREPVIARLCRQPLVRFSSANWFWGIAGAALGSLCAGWGIDAGIITMLLLVASATSLVVAIGVAALLPRDSRRSPASALSVKTLFAASLWTPQAIMVVSLIVWLSFVAGPLDNLLVPAHLAGDRRSADVFGTLIAAGGTGLAVGLAAVQTEQATSAQRQSFLIPLGLLGMLLQAGLVWWLPQTWLLTVGVFITSAMLAPLFPLLESATLLAVKAPVRTLLLAVAGSAASTADMVGTAAFGWLISLAGTDTALGACTFMMLPTLIVVLMYSRHWRLAKS